MGRKCLPGSDLDCIGPGVGHTPRWVPGEMPPWGPPVSFPCADLRGLGSPFLSPFLPSRSRGCSGQEISMHLPTEYILISPPPKTAQCSAAGVLAPLHGGQVGQNLKPQSCSVLYGEQQCLLVGVVCLTSGQRCGASWSLNPWPEPQQ